MIKIFPFKNWKKYSNLNRFFIITGFITILGFIGFLVVTFAGNNLSKKDIEPLAKATDVNDIRKQLLQIENELNRSLINADTIVYPGYSISLLAKIYNKEYDRLAYIFDIGNYSEKERFSLYLNKSNELCFRIIDSNEVIRTISVNATSGYFTFDRLMFITCEYAQKDNKSFQRLLINGRVIESYSYSSNLQLANKINLVGSTYGADLSGNNCSSILLKTFSVAHTTFTQNEVLAFKKIVDTYLKKATGLTDFGDLNCDYYFRVKADTNLEKIKTGT